MARYVHFDIVFRIEVDTQAEFRADEAAVDAMRFVHRRMLDHDKRMKDAFGARVRGSMLKAAEKPCSDWACPNAATLAEEDSEEAA